MPSHNQLEEIFATIVYIRDLSSFRVCETT